jgi:type I restriction enzyme S subunit
LLVPLPPRREQDRIVESLGEQLANVKSGASSLQQALARLRQYRAACLASAFSGDATGVVMTEAVLDSLAHVQSGIAKGRPAGEDVLEMPYIRTANVQGGYLDLSVIKTLPVTGEQKAKHLLRNGDVLVLEGGDADKVGRGWLWSGEIPDCLHQNHVFAVRPHSGSLLSKYLAYFVNAPQARRYFLACAKQTTNLASINKRQLKALPVHIPMDTEEQHAIVARLDNQLRSAALYEAHVREQLQQSAALRTSLLNAACVGRLSAPEASDGPVGESLATFEDAARNGSRRKKARAVLVGE